MNTLRCQFRLLHSSMFLRGMLPIITEVMPKVMVGRTLMAKRPG